MIYVDRPLWPAHGTVFAHVISDTSADELHAFARRARLDPRAWDGDHYDVPLRRYDDVLAAGAQVVDGRTLARLLADSGLRFRKRKGERPLASTPNVAPGLSVPHRLDVVRSRLETPAATTVAAATFARDENGRVLLVRTVTRGAWEAPAGGIEVGETPREAAVREVHEEAGLAIDPAALVPVGYERIVLEAPHGRWRHRENHVQVYAATVASAPLAPRPGETTDAQWVPVTDVEALCGEQMWWPLLADHLRAAAGAR